MSTIFRATNIRRGKSQSGTVRALYAVRRVSYDPARAAGMLEHGEISAGKRADLVPVAHVNGLVQPVVVLSAGKHFFEVSFGHG